MNSSFRFLRLSSIISNLIFKRGSYLRKIGRLAASHRRYVAAAKLGHREAALAAGENYKRGFGCVRSDVEAFQWFKRSAELGSSEAQFQLGIAYLSNPDGAFISGVTNLQAQKFSKLNSPFSEILYPTGTEYKRDERQARYWLELAAKSNKPEAQANLGWLILNGIGGAKDVEAARNWFLLASKSNISQAALGLAEIYGNKNYGNFDIDKSKFWLRCAADQGSASACFSLAMEKLKDSDRTADDHRDALAYLLTAAQSGLTIALFEYGRQLILERTDSDGIEDATNFIRQAAKGGLTSAANFLGHLYSRGEKIQPDLKESFKWFRLAADAGDPQAQFQVGCLFARGDGVPRDTRNAARYFEKSAKLNHPIASYNLGVFLETGEGVDQDLIAAYAWLSKAAELDLVAAQVRLAKLIQSGRLPGVDLSFARKLLEKAATANDPDAQFLLSQILLNDGIEDNVERGLECLRLAVGSGHFLAADFALSQQNHLKIDRSVALVAFKIIQREAAKGNIRASIILARQYCTGIVVSKDMAAAEEILINAAESGDPNALFELGVFYCTRNVGKADIQNGFQSYLRAAEFGHVIAQYNIGLMFLEGVGVAVDVSRGHEFLRAASAQGFKKAAEVLAIKPDDL